MYKWKYIYIYTLDALSNLFLDTKIAFMWCLACWSTQLILDFGVRSLRVFLVQTNVNTTQARGRYLACKSLFSRQTL